MSKKQGFGMVQLLISMMIISFCYVLLMPHIALSTKSSDGSKNKAPMQQAYSFSKTATIQQLSSAARMASITNGGSLQGLCSTNACMAEEFAKQMSIMKKCTASFSGCWHNGGSDFGGLMLMSGALVSFENTNSSCPNGICSTVHLDVNGFKAPNKEGADIFSGYITTNSAQ